MTLAHTPQFKLAPSYESRRMLECPSRGIVALKDGEAFKTGDKSVSLDRTAIDKRVLHSASHPGHARLPDKDNGLGPKIIP